MELTLTEKVPPNKQGRKQENNACSQLKRPD